MSGTDDESKCAPQESMAPLFYKISRVGLMASCLQTDDDGRDLLGTISNGDMGLVRNDLRIMDSLKEISPVMHKVSVTSHKYETMRCLNGIGITSLSRL